MTRLPGYALTLRERQGLARQELIDAATDVPTHSSRERQPWEPTCDHPPVYAEIPHWGRPWSMGVMTLIPCECTPHDRGPAARIIRIDEWIELAGVAPGPDWLDG